MLVKRLNPLSYSPSPTKFHKGRKQQVIYNAQVPQVMLQILTLPVKTPEPWRREGYVNQVLRKHPNLPSVPSPGVLRECGRVVVFHNVKNGNNPNRLGVLVSRALVLA